MIRNAIAIMLLLLLSVSAHGQWVQVVGGGLGYLRVANDTLFLHDESGELFRSCDHGVSWSLFSGSPVIATAPDIFARIGTVAFKDDSINGIMRSYDNGAHWSTVFKSAQWSSVYGIPGLLASNGSILYVLDDSLHLHFSTDSGSSWMAAPVNDTVQGNYIAASGNVLFDAYEFYDGRVYFSTDRGTTWNRTGTMHRVSNIAVSGPNVVVATWNTGIWYARIKDFETMSQVNITEQLPDAEIFPNPTSRYISVRASDVLSVKLFNALGDEVIGSILRGAGNVSLDLAPLPSGAYFLKIETGSGIAFRTVIKE